MGDISDAHIPKRPRGAMAAVAGFTVPARAGVTAARQTSIARKSTVVVAPPARRGSSVVTNFNPAAGDFSVSLSQGVGAGVAVVVARVVLFSLAKAGIGKNVEKWSAKCAEYGIDCSDLYHTEDQVRAGHLVSSPTPVLSKKFFPPILARP